MTNEKDPAFFRYGGAGIEMDPRWLSFEIFLSDMGEKPNKRWSIDRIDSRLGYWKSNCRWVAGQIQCENQICNRFFAYEGEVMTFSNLARRAGLRPGTVFQRERRGKGLQEAFGLSGFREVTYDEYVEAERGRATRSASANDSAG